MPQRTGRIIAGVAAGVAMLAALGMFAGPRLLREPGADDSYDTRVAQPALASRAPRVLYDEAHNNAHSIRGRYSPFAKLLRADGCSVQALRDAVTPERLKGANILVIVNACADEPKRESDAFTPAERAAIRDWVRAGGSLLLVADHHPYGESAAPLAAEFNVSMSGGWTDDESHARAGSGDPGQLLFSRENGLLGEHAITLAADAERAIATVESFTGQSLLGPPDAAALLRLADSAIDRIPRGSVTKTEGGRTTTTFETDDRSAAGRAQGLALRFGAGRVVVLGEAAMLTAQSNKGQTFGMNSPNNDNRAFALNTVRWLAGALGE